jgi:hypothetical protein
MPNYTYSVLVILVFWLLWIVAFLVLLLFAFFTVITVTDANSGLMAAWNGLVVLAEVIVLFIATRHFIRKDIPSSKLLLWITGAALGLPLLASGGCIMLDSMGAGFRIAG